MGNTQTAASWEYVAPTEVGYVNTPWLWLSSIFFFFAAIFTDILLVRACLASAYCCLFSNAIYASLTTGRFALDSFLWAILTGFFQFRHLLQMIREEIPPPPLKNPDDQALFAFIHRRSGMVQRDYHRFKGDGLFRHYQAGDTVCDALGARQEFFIIIEGCVEIDVVLSGGDKSIQKKLFSGDAFDLRILNLSGVQVGFANEHFEAVAKTPCMIFVKPVPEFLKLLRTHSYLSNFLRALALCFIAKSVQRNCILDAYGGSEDLPALESGHRSNDFRPLTKEEETSVQWTWKKVFKWIRSSIRIKARNSGIRHMAAPSGGSLATAEVRAVTEEALKRTSTYKPAVKYAPRTEPVRLTDAGGPTMKKDVAAGKLQAGFRGQRDRAQVNKMKGGTGEEDVRLHVRVRVE
mmetsp:Transcript_9792/g.16252  ORF Transcript_9792/g.16252 Transcript_9792/m.16252 type:complete len:406 (+) Transcript_9792:34-1251(+)